jgi:hypothetical protein
MPVAKENLLLNGVIAALPGGYVTKEAVKKYGWKDQVEDGPDQGGTGEEKDDAAPKGAAQKGR